MISQDKYIPAIRFTWLAPLYDPLMRVLMREDEFKGRLVRNANIQAGHHVLDLGCGTATLTLMVKKAHPQAEVVGVDGDDKILAIANEKVKRAGLNVTLDKALAYDLPYQNGSFDRVLSSLVIHHLTTENKERAFAEIRRVLRKPGELHVVDFGLPISTYARVVSRFLSRIEPLGDNIQGRLPEMMRKAGLTAVRTAGHFATVFGTLVYYRAGA